MIYNHTKLLSLVIFLSATCLIFGCSQNKRDDYAVVNSSGGTVLEPDENDNISIDPSDDNGNSNHDADQMEMKKYDFTFSEESYTFIADTPAQLEALNAGFDISIIEYPTADAQAEYYIYLLEKDSIIHPGFTIIGSQVLHLKSSIKFPGSYPERIKVLACDESYPNCDEPLAEKYFDINLHYLPDEPAFALNNDGTLVVHSNYGHADSNGIYNVGTKNSNEDDEPFHAVRVKAYMPDTSEFTVVSSSKNAIVQSIDSSGFNLLVQGFGVGYNEYPFSVITDAGDEYSIVYHHFVWGRYQTSGSLSETVKAGANKKSQFSLWVPDAVGVGELTLEQTEGCAPWIRFDVNELAPGYMVTDVVLEAPVEPAEAIITCQMDLKKNGNLIHQYQYRLHIQ